MLVMEGQDPDLFARIQEKNLIRQYDLLMTCIELGLKQGPTALDKYALWALNHVAVANISQLGGRFRQEPIYVGKHMGILSLTNPRPIPRSMGSGETHGQKRPERSLFP